MYRLAVLLVLVPFAGAVAKDRGGDFDACSEGQIDVQRKTADFRGEDRMKRLIEADLTRARKEAAEGDADECLEALAHANKLIAGQY